MKKKRNIEVFHGKLSEVFFRNRLTDLKNKHVYQEESGEGVVREFEINTDTLLYLKWIKCF